MANRLLGVSHVKSQNGGESKANKVETNFLWRDLMNTSQGEDCLYLECLIFIKEDLGSGGGITSFTN